MLAKRQALKRADERDGVKGGCCYQLDPKALCKSALFGALDPTTREWTDGVFTSILRQIVDGLRGGKEGRYMHARTHAHTRTRTHARTHTHAHARIQERMVTEMESGSRQWIVLDGDVDPEWVENLNSLLDDNRLLTLPNGERIVLPANVRIIFEVQVMRLIAQCWFSIATATCLCA